MEEVINPEELEALFDWIIYFEYEDISWQDFCDNSQYFVDRYFDNYTDWIANREED
jgi:hypothetical protein